MNPKAQPTTPATPQIRLLLGVAFLAYLAQMSLGPIIAPLSREVGLAEWQVGVTISTAALMLVATSQFWGRRSQSWGRKPVLLIAFLLATCTMILFALLAQLGMTGIVTGTVLFALFVLLRGIGFGGALAAIAPTAQAYIADVTPDEATRVKGMAGVGAVQGMAILAGSVLGGLLAVFGLMAPLIAVPVLLALGFTLVSFGLRREPETTLIDKPVRVRPTDRRIWPFLVTGFGMFSALGFIQVIGGFIIQDRLHLDAQTTAVVTGGTGLAAGLGMVLAQGVIVPRSGWSPATLLRVGGAIAVVGFLILIPDAGAIPIFASMTLIGLGLGIAMPGYTAGPTLLVDREEQGGLAGLLAATTGLTFVIAPAAGTALYSAWAPLPIIVGAILMTLITAFVLIHPRFRRMPHTATVTDRGEASSTSSPNPNGETRRD